MNSIQYFFGLLLVQSFVCFSILAEQVVTFINGTSEIAPISLAISTCDKQNVRLSLTSNQPQKINYPDACDLSTIKQISIRPLTQKRSKPSIINIDMTKGKTFIIHKDSDGTYYIEYQ